MFGAFVLPLLLVLQGQRPIAANDAPPAGQRIDLKDGDTVVIRGGDRVRVIRRTAGMVRILYNPANRWIAILYDASDPAGVPSDGQVDGGFDFHDLDGSWPLGERWQGRAVIDEYLMTEGLLRVGIGITTDTGLIQLFPGSPASPTGNRQWFLDSRASAVLYYHSGGGAGLPATMSFDQAEQFVARQAAHQGEVRDAGTSNPAQIAPA